MPYRPTETTPDESETNEVQPEFASSQWDEVQNSTLMETIISLDTLNKIIGLVVRKTT